MVEAGEYRLARASRHPGEGVAQKRLTAQLDPGVKALEAFHQQRGLGKLPGAQGETIEALEVESQALLEYTQGPSMNRQEPGVVSLAAAAEHTAIRDVEAEGPRPVQRTRAAHTGRELGLEAERLEGSQLEEDPEPGIRRMPFEHPQRRQRKIEELAGLRGVAAFGRQSSQQLDEPAPHREAGGMPTQGQEGGFEARLGEVVHSTRAALQPHREVIHQIEGPGEALHALARALRHRRNAAEVGGQEVDDAIRLTDVDASQNDRLGLDAGHGRHSPF